MRGTKGLIIADPWIGYTLGGEMRPSVASHRGWVGLIRKDTGAVHDVARLIKEVATYRYRVSLKKSGSLQESQ